MLFRTSPEKLWNLIASNYAESPIADIAAYKKKDFKGQTPVFPIQKQLRGVQVLEGGGKWLQNSLGK